MQESIPEIVNEEPEKPIEIIISNEEGKIDSIAADEAILPPQEDPEPISSDAFISSITKEHGIYITEKTIAIGKRLMVDSTTLKKLRQLFGISKTKNGKFTLTSTEIDKLWSRLSDDHKLSHLSKALATALDPPTQPSVAANEISEILLETTTDMHVVASETVEEMIADSVEERAVSPSNEVAKVSEEMVIEIAHEMDIVIADDLQDHSIPVDSIVSAESAPIVANDPVETDIEASQPAVDIEPVIESIPAAEGDITMDIAAVEQDISNQLTEPSSENSILNNLSSLAPHGASRYSTRGNTSHYNYQSLDSTFDFLSSFQEKGKHTRVDSIRYQVSVPDLISLPNKLTADPLTSCSGEKSIGCSVASNAIRTLVIIL